MKIAVSGMAPREEAAFSFFLERNFKGWSWVRAAAQRGVALPPAELYVVDVLAAGLPHASAEAKAQLLILLQGTPAVLLLSANETSWPEALSAEGWAREHGIVWLHKPYGTEAMRDALQKAAALGRARAPVAAAMPAARAVSAAPRVGAGMEVGRGIGQEASIPPAAAAAPEASQAPRAAVWVAPRPVVAVTAPTAGTAENVAPTLSVEQFAARIAAAPADAPGRRFFMRLTDLMKAQQPFEIGFTIQNLLVFHPANDWVASNTPMSVVQRVSRSDALSSVVSVRELDAAQAEARVQQLGLQLRELEAFLAEWIDGWAQDEPQAQRAYA